MSKKLSTKRKIVASLLTFIFVEGFFFVLSWLSQNPDGKSYTVHDWLAVNAVGGGMILFILCIMGLAHLWAIN